VAATCYEVRVAGRMSERASSLFAGMTVVPVAPQTIIYGRVGDDAELHGLLALCQELGLQVVAIHEAPSEASSASGGRGAGREKLAAVCRDDRGPAAADPELQVDRSQVRLNGVDRDQEVLGDLLE
jgi:hypothetical protein